MKDRVYNFAAGPSCIPLEVLEKARDELVNFGESGMSVMEMTHRGKDFAVIFSRAKEQLRRALSVPESHEILFLQGGATLQFAAVPMNLLGTGTADYAVTGQFSGKAAKEAEKYGKVHLACDTSASGHDRIPAQGELRTSENAAYFYYCSNNTIYGTEWYYTPETDAVLVCDMSSDILSRPVDVSRYGLIYAGAQKNMSPAGLTVVVLDRELAGKALSCTPEVMRYDVLIENDSMLNTPPCWCIYMLSLELEWLEKQGGVSAMEKMRKERAALVYDVLDNSRFYIAHAQPDSRSFMNVTFRTPSEDLDRAFVAGAEKCGLVNLKGHRLTGGIRASLYNSMPMEGALRLAEYMKRFEEENRCMQ
ncbi:MAG: 3-phosphoserine/phosphohydroxythreonine transaminase [Oscillospiraceae bacterium]|nr:3-phosphoserine/phosphohydroxythreonine transaminase [Oscillospiraceae bacterium]